MGDLNPQIVAKIQRSRLSRLEGASAPMPVTLYSPEAKRLFARFFDSVQANYRHMMMRAKHQFPADVTRTVKDVLAGEVNLARAIVQHGLQQALQLAATQVVDAAPHYPDLPLDLTAHVYVAFGTQFLDLLREVDRWMVVHDALAARGVMAGAATQRDKRAIKRLVKQIARRIRRWKDERDAVQTAEQHARWPSDLRRDARLMRLNIQDEATCEIEPVGTVTRHPDKAQGGQGWSDIEGA